MNRPRTPVGRFAAAASIGGAVAMVVLAWFTLHGSLELFAREESSLVYDAQARALLDGRWDLSAGEATHERFAVGGRFYAYFGPFPALLRIPTALVGRGEGVLARPALLLACALVLAASARLLWLARRALGLPAPGRADLLAAGAFMVLLGCGSIVVYLAGWASVYHEALLWGVGWSLAAYGFLAAWLLDGRRRDVALAGLAAALAVLSRAAVGIGPLAALGVVLLARLFAIVRRRARPTGDLAVLGGAVAVPAGLHAYVSVAKFGSPFGVPPLAKQDVLAALPTRAAALAANGGNLFGLVYTPTIVWQYLRPDAIRFTQLFPWVTFDPDVQVLGGAVFEAVHPTVSLPASAPLLVALGVVGVVVMVQRRLGGFAVLLAGAAIGSAGAVSLAFVDQRYQGDVLPVLVIAGAVGWWPLLGAVRRLSRHRRRATLGLVAFAAAWSIWVCTAIAYTYQRAYRPDVTNDERASLVRAQLAVHDLLSDGAPPGVRRGDDPGEAGPAGTLFVRGRCAAVLWSDGREWHAIETTSRSGRFRLRARPEGSARQELLHTRSGAGTGTFAGRRVGERLVVTYTWRPVTGAPTRIETRVPLDRRGETRLELLLDQRNALNAHVVVRVNGDVVLDRPAPIAVGPAQLNAAWRGSLELLPAPTPICRSLQP